MLKQEIKFIILYGGWILRKLSGGRTWAGLIWLRIGTAGGLLYVR